MKRIHFVGLGNMGAAIIKGLNNSEFRGTLSMSGFDTDSQKLNDLKQYLIDTDKNNSELVKSTDAVLLAVKPNIVSVVLNEIRDAVADKIVISIAAGVKISKIQKATSKQQKIVRIMPNTPLQVGRGVSAITFTETVSKSEREDIISIFKTVSEVFELDEKYFDIITAVSGSGPAFVLYFINSIIDAAVSEGLARPVATEIVKYVFLGASEWFEKSGKHPVVLMDTVTSPGGTTIAGLSKFDELGCKNSIVQGIIAASDISKEL